MFDSVDAVQQALNAQDYIAERSLTTAIYLALRLQKPIFLEGEAGVGKTEVAKVLSLILETPLIRLQCYEGVDANAALYEWNYAHQLLHMRLLEASGASREEMRSGLFSREFLQARPLLQAVEASSFGSAPVLLIDEIDRADEEFEAFLLELLSDFQVTIPELGTIVAEIPPVVVVTSNRTREIHDALKRRCLYYWIDYPSFQKELRIVERKAPDVKPLLARQVTAFIQELRRMELFKSPGVAETIDWTAALIALDQQELSEEIIRDTVGVIFSNTRMTLKRLVGLRFNHCLTALNSKQRPLDKAVSKKTSLYLGSDDSTYEGGRLLHNLLLFGRLCRALGMDVTPNGMVEVARALEFIELGRKDDVYHTLRAMMVTRQRDLALFDEAFNLFWQRPVEDWTTLDLSSLGETRRQKKTQFLPPPEANPDDDSSNGSQPDPTLIAIVPTYSQQELLRYKDFAEMSGEEITAAQRLMERLAWSLGTRETRRFKAGKGKQIDLRRVIRQNMRFAGELLVLPERRHKIKPRPLVLLCDVSGSMERYTRLLLQFTHILSSSIYQVESFVFSTRLTRITRQLRHKSVDAALREVGQSVKDWGGGTRTGDALHTFNYFWARRVLGRGAVVLVITDGWDRGEPDVLRHEMERLQRNSYRLMWLNPLLGAPEYEPLTRGAQAMLPFVDDFLPIRNLANLEMLARELWRVNWRRPERARTSSY